jgi:hypothetical protein
MTQGNEYCLLWRRQKHHISFATLHMVEESKCSPQADFASSVKCSTEGGAAKWGPTILRHC